MATQLSGIQWTGKEEVLGLSQTSVKSLHSDARASGVLGCRGAARNSPLPWIIVDHKAPVLSPGVT